jgi:hypothetical protein
MRSSAIDKATNTKMLAKMKVMEITTSTRLVFPENGPLEKQL